METNQRQLVTKLQELSERLDRIERNAPAAATAGLASKLEQLNERLDRTERSAAIVAPPQAPAVATSPTPAARSAAIEAPTSPASSALKLQVPIETKKIPNWVVREVLNGQGDLAGPRGYNRRLHRRPRPRRRPRPVDRPSRRPVDRRDEQGSYKRTLNRRASPHRRKAPTPRIRLPAPSRFSAPVRAELACQPKERAT